LWPERLLNGLAGNKAVQSRPPAYRGCKWAATRGRWRRKRRAAVL